MRCTVFILSLNLTETCLCVNHTKPWLIDFGTIDKRMNQRASASYFLHRFKDLFSSNSFSLVGFVRFASDSFSSDSFSSRNQDLGVVFFRFGFVRFASYSISSDSFSSRNRSMYFFRFGIRFLQFKESIDVFLQSDVAFTASDFVP
ncbi:hypothetical protein L6452_16825 [Arctium lappa]|uniref:Uncharacterized protein n=1 Tax=Arctium lappa TaxID=4217 RepID=A0ACB9C1X7_ARCLA|nr:hypothetical protein L6452_16825 [Arctium lappa]